MNLKKWMRSGLIASAFAMALPTAVHASTIDIPLFGSHTAPGSPRIDNYNFSLNPSGSAMISVLFNSNLTGSYALFSGGTPSGSSILGGTFPTGVSLSLPLGSGLSGLYTLSITSALMPGATTGFYNGAITLAPVPEAGELVMFTLGMAAVAGAVRRRKAKVAQAAA